MRHNQLALMTVILMGLTACSIRIGLEPPTRAAVATMNPAPTLAPSPVLAEVERQSPTAAPGNTPVESTILPAATSEPVSRYLADGTSRYPADPAAYGSGGVLLYALHEPVIDLHQYYATTLTMVTLDEAGSPTGPPQVWYEWNKYAHAGMYALPDHTGVVEQTDFEAGRSAWITWPSVPESWSISPPIISDFPWPIGWTVDSRGLLYAGVNLPNNHSALVLVRPESAEILLVDTSVAGAALSPDGGMLVYSVYEGSNVEGTLWRLDIASGVAEQIAEEIVIDLAWSPDGQWIAGESNGRVYVIRPDGSGFQRVSDASTFEIYEPLQWSPSGDALLFTAYAGQAPLALQDPDAFAFQYNAYIADIGSAGVGEVSPVVPGSDAGYIDPSWSPDGQSILVVGPGAGSADVWLVSRDSQSVQQITFDGSAKRYPVWIVAGQ